MNDPGLDEPINNAGDQVKENTPGAAQDDTVNEEDEETNFLLPAKWWYASTAFPLIAGTFGPMANAFSICALVENWRVSIPPGGTEEHGIDIKDPKWLIAINAVSLVFALIANLSLLMNMARRISFQVAQPITIAGFWVASILLIALVAVASRSSDFKAPNVKNQALTQAYYYAIFAAGLYQIISYLMCVTVWGAYNGHYSKEFKLTISQRTLMLQTISFLVYLLLGALVYCKIEGWKFLDAVYWADFTCLTIGVGDDYTPTTHLGRSLLFPFALGGIVILGLVVGSIRSLVIDRSAKKMKARMTEKTRRRVLKRIADAEKKNPKNAKVLGLSKNIAQVLTKPPSESGATEVERRKAEFEAMRVVQEMAATERKWVSLAISTLSFAFLWTIGALVFWRSEKNQDWSYFEAFYFSYTTLLTIGYGDFEPISNSGKPFFVFWSLLAIPTLTILISNMGDTVVKGVKDATIWLGEVTVLPSDDYAMKDRLRYGIHKASNGRFLSAKVGKGYNTDEEQEELDEDFARFSEMNPGFAKMPSTDQFKKHHVHPHLHKNRSQKADLETGDRLAEDFEKSEEKDEEIAQLSNDPIARDDHHYRHILISQIRRVYRDASAPSPKHYTYEEWAFFLALLGQHEADTRFHRKAPVKTNDTIADPNAGMGGSEKKEQEQEQHGVGVDDTTQKQDGSGEKAESESEECEQNITKWSWIGNRSPLMGDQDEPEWILEKLFQKLEESLRVAQDASGGHGKTDEVDLNLRSSAMRNTKTEPLELTRGEDHAKEDPERKGGFGGKAESGERERNESGDRTLDGEEEGEGVDKENQEPGEGKKD